MAIVNRTPDSFYDGGVNLDLSAALAAVARAVDDGADIVDVGGVRAGVARPSTSPRNCGESYPWCRTCEAASRIW